MKDKEIIKKSIFKQSKQRKVYDFRIWMHEARGEAGNIYNKFNSIPNSDEEIFVCDLPMPLLEFGDEFYIEEKNLLITIDKVVRTSNDNICYYAVPKIIEDDITKNSLEKAEQLKKDFIANKQQIDNLKSFKNRVKSSFWYKFMNIKD